MTFSDIFLFAFNVLGGLGIFLYGLKVMSNTLQKVSADKLKIFFNKVTHNRFTGLGFGALITCILQSSSATTVLMIGFVNAGVIGLAQCISIIFGANIGTTITAQIIAFKYSDIALPMVGIGAAFVLFSRNRKWNAFGEILVGLGLIFFGLKTLGTFLKPLRDIPAFSHALVTFGQHPVLGMIVGTIVTIIFQSSSATTGMIIVLAGGGLMNFQSAFALELGANIGTTITAQIAAIGTNVNAKRAAWAHTLFNVIGAFYMLLLLHVHLKGQPIFLRLIDYLTPGDVFLGENLERHIANAHTIFNVFNAIVLFPFITQFAKLTELIVPNDAEESEVDRMASHLDDRVTASPPAAIDMAWQETLRMGRIAKEMLGMTRRNVLENDIKAEKKITEYEDTLNQLQKRIIGFVTDIDHDVLTEKQVDQSQTLIQMVRHFERIGDNFKAIQAITDTYRHDHKMNFKEQITAHIKEQLDSLDEFFNKTMGLLESDEFALDMNMFSEFENYSSEREHKYREAYIQQLTQKVVSPQEAIYILEFSAHLEQISRYLVKIHRQLKAR